MLRGEYMAIDHDRLFKELIQTFFEEFILLFFPEMYDYIDFQHLSFLSEELFTDVTAGEKYRVDLLVETKLKGEDGLIIVHIENQSYVQPSFPERMFIYFSRLFEKYRTKIVPIAVLATMPSATNHPRLRFNFRLATSFTSAFSPSNYANKIGATTFAATIRSPLRC
jgi:hypothetical protein